MILTSHATRLDTSEDVISFINNELCYKPHTKERLRNF